MKVLFVNHAQKMCGVYQYGDRFFSIIEKDKRYISMYMEASSAQEYLSGYPLFNPDVIVFNWHGGTMDWLTQDVLKRTNTKTLVFHHEQFETPLLSLRPDAFIAGSQDEYDPNRPLDRRVFVLPRPLFERDYVKPNNSILTIGSFGTGSSRKGFDDVCRKVCEEFDEAVINIHMTNPFFAYDNGAGLQATIKSCENAITKNRVRLNITTDFISNEQLASRLQKNDINIFLYNDKVYGLCGIASVLDFAVGIETPFAVNSNPMFRHVSRDYPEINLDHNSISEVVSLGNYPAVELKNKWNNNNLRDAFFDMIMEL